jgi:thiopeptide-type bacteriocin biosynthesis protein
VLWNAVAPVVEAAKRSGASDCWFFIRYADPDPHLRLRLHGAPERLLSEVMPALHAAIVPLLEDGRILRLQLETYEREVERYGGAAGIVLAEQIFHADSEAVLAIVQRLDGDAGADARWRLTLRGMDMLLADLGLDTAARHDVIRRARDRYLQEFRANASLKRQLGELYRRQRRSLELLLDPSNDLASPLAPGFAALHRRSKQLAPVAQALVERERAGLLAQPIVELASSFLHMHANRLLRSAQRRQELVIYELLDRIYEGRAARARQLH